MAKKINPFADPNFGADPQQSDNPFADPNFDGESKSPRISDYLKQGTAGAASGLGMAFQGGGDLLARGVNEVGKAVGHNPKLTAENPLRSVTDSLNASMSPEAKQAMADSTPTGNIAEPSTWSLGKKPSIAGYALQAANTVGQFAPNLAVGVATGGLSMPAQAAVGGAFGGIQAYGGGNEDERNRFMAMSHDELMQGSSVYADLIKQGVKPEEAKAAVAEKAAIGGGIGNAIPSSLEGAAENVLIGMLTQGKLKVPAMFGSGVLGKAATGLVGGAATGGTEEAVEQAAQNIGVNKAVGGNRSVGDDTLNQFVLGALGEGLVGGAGGAISHVMQPKEAAPNPPAAPEVTPPAPVIAAPEGSLTAAANIAQANNITPSNPHEESDLVVSENRDAEFRRAQLQLDQKKQQELDAIAAARDTERGVLPDQQVAAADVATDETPTTVAQAFMRAQAAKAEQQRISDEAHAAATSPLNALAQPSEAQKQAGNYKKGHVKFNGLDLTIENPAGSIRSGTDADGKTWENVLNNHYGYIKRTTGNDGDNLDVFIGNNPASDKVFVVNQINPKTGEFDEHKAILGANNAEDAVAIYKSNYAEDWQGGKSVTELTIPAFKDWVKHGDTKKALETVALNPATDVANLAEGETVDVGGVPYRKTASGFERVHEGENVATPPLSPATPNNVSTALQGAIDNNAGSIDNNTHAEATPQNAQVDSANTERLALPNVPETAQTPIAPERVAASEPAPALAPVSTTIRKGEIGSMLAAKEVVSTATGRPTTPFPNFNGKDGKVSKFGLKAVDKWLVDNAIAEAQARKDDFNLTQFKAIDLKNISQSDKDSAEMYLFDNVQPKVVPSILKDVVPQPAASSNEKAAPTLKKAPVKKSNSLLATLKELGGVTMKDKRDVTGEDKKFAAGGYNQVFTYKSNRSLKGLIESGDLDEYLPHNLRLESNSMNDAAFDSTEAYDYLADKIRSGERVLPYEVEQEAKANKFYEEQGATAQGDIELAAQLLTEDEINERFRIASHQEREATTEARQFKPDLAESDTTGSAGTETATSTGQPASQAEQSGAQQDLLGDNTATKQAIADAERAKDAQRNTGTDNQGTFTLTGSNSEADKAAANGAQDLFVEANNKGVADKPASKLSKQPNTKAASSAKADLLDSKTTNENIQDLGEKIGGARKDQAVSTSPKTKRVDSNPEVPTWAKRYKIHQIAASSKAEEVGTWVIQDSREKNRFGMAKEIARGFATKEAAEAELPALIVGLKHRVYATAKRDDGTYGYEIYRNISDRKRVKIVDKVFDDRMQALAYMGDHAAEILDTNTTFGEIDLPTPDDINRIGVERRQGDVASRDFMTTFGFRGVEFGNWNNQIERQQVMNAAYDGLLDLADVLNLPPKALALNGDLALAFGARGQGLSSAKAHYERNKAVINLTKMNGAGSLAHEWLHALDHYFGRLDSKASSEWETNQDGTRSLKAHAEASSDMVSGGFSYQSKVREELRTAYNSLMEAMFRKATTYVEDTQKADAFVGRAKEDLAQQLDKLRAELSMQKDVKYYKRKNAPASAEQLMEFDTIAKQLLDGQNLTTSYRATNPNAPVRRYGSISGRATNDALEKLSAIYKDVRGRSGFDSTNNHGVMDYLRGAMSRYNGRLQLLEEAQQGAKKVKQVPTDFAMNAKELDQGRGSDYWTTPHEMAARAFQGYVEDKVAEKGGKSPFLNYGKENAGILTPWGFKYPFPRGEERKAINAAFDKFVSEIQTKDTEKGTTLYSRDYQTQFNEPTLNANGKPIYSTQSGIANFWEWFNGFRDQVLEGQTGSGENARGLRATSERLTRQPYGLDEQGRPKIFLHGTASNFSAFDFEHAQRKDHGWLGDGVYLTDDPLLAQSYANLKAGDAHPNIMPVYAAIHNPFYATIADKQKLQKYSKADIKEFTERLKSEGYDGVVLKFNDDTSEVVALYPNQVKSAIGNNGEFDPNNPDIRYSRPAAPTFYSALARAIPQAKQDTMPAAQWKNWLVANAGKMNVKQAELQWSGITDWLAMQQGKVSKADIQAYLDANGVQVTETLLGGSGRFDSSNYDELPADVKALVDSVDNGELDEEELPAEAAKIGYRFDFDLEGTLQGIYKIGENFEPTKYKSYAVAGGKNYKELLLTLPEKTQDRPRMSAELLNDGSYQVTFADTERFVGNPVHASGYVDAVNKAWARYTKENPEKIGNFRSAHFDKPNILAHIRFDERTDADGNKVLFINEIQSDWGQSGRKLGFQKDDRQAKADYPNLQNEFAYLKERRAALRAEMAALPDSEMTKFNQMQDDMDKLDDRLGIVSSELGRISDLFSGNSRMQTPAPFVTDTKAWVGLAIKRMVRYAAENGFNKVAFVTGEQAANLYDLSKQVGFVALDKHDVNSFTVTAYKNENATNEVLSQSVDSLEKVADIIGKSATEKLVKDMGNGTHGELVGADLKIGGEGMGAFYDKIVPQVANDVLKALGGGKLETINLEAGKPFAVEDGNGNILKSFSTKDEAESYIRQGFGEEISYNPSDKVRDQLSQSKTQQGFTITPEMRAVAMEGQPLFSRPQSKFTEATAKGITIDQRDLKAVVANVAEKLKGLPEIHVLEDYTFAPAELLADIEQDQAYTAAGAWHNGEIYLFRNNIFNANHALFTLLHESTHEGLRRLFGKNIDATLMGIYLSNPSIKKQANTLRKQHQDLSLVASVEEALADMGGHSIHASVMDKLVAFVRGTLRKLGMNLSITDGEIRSLVTRALKSVRSPSKVTHFTVGSAYNLSPADSARVSQSDESGLYQVVQHDKVIDSFTVQAKADEFAHDLNQSEYVVADSRYSRLYQVTPDQEQALKNVGAIIAPKTIGQWFADKKVEYTQNLAQKVADQFAPLRNLDMHAYVLARMSKSYDGAMEALLNFGNIYVDAQGANNTDVTKGTSFIKSLQRLQGEQQRFFWWIAANRAEQLSAESREHLFSGADIAALKTLNTGNLPDGQDRATIYKEVLAEYTNVSKSVLDAAEASGIINGESRAIWEKEFYVPFYRALEDGISSPNIGSKTGLVRQYAFKKLKGGSGKIHHDLMANVMLNWTHLIAASGRNRAAQAALQAGEKAGIATALPEAQKGSVFYLDDGQQKHYMVDDPTVLDAITSLEYAGLGGGAMRVLSGFKRALTYGVTFNPAFKIRNIIRDTLSAIAINDISYNPAKTLTQGVGIMRDKESQTYASLLAGGGIIRFGTMLEGNSSIHLNRLINAGVDMNNIIDTKEKAMDMLTKATDWYNELGDISEGANRAALYKQLRDKGLSHLEASYQARDMLDFTMGGTSGAIRFLVQTVPFMNARIQGLYKLGRAGKANPQRMAAVIGATALASIMLMLAFQGDDDWKKREDWDRDNYWWFKIGDTAYRIPKPFEIGTIATLAERGLEYLTDDEMTNQRLWERIQFAVSQTLAFNPIPQLFKPAIDVYSNTDSFTGRPIETMGMERLQKQDRVTRNTSELARGLGVVGQYADLSPVQIDHLVRGYFGWLGIAGNTAVDLMASPITNRPEKPSRQLKDMFLVGNFAEGLPSDSSRYLTQFYEQSKEIEQAYASWRAKVKDRDVEGARAFREDNAEQIRQYHRIERQKKLLTNINTRINQVYNSGLDADTKREKLNVLNARKAQLAEQVDRNIH